MLLSFLLLLSYDDNLTLTMMKTTETGVADADAADPNSQALTMITTLTSPRVPRHSCPTNPALLTLPLPTIIILTLIVHFAPLPPLKFSQHRQDPIKTNPRTYSSSTRDQFLSLPHPINHKQIKLLSQRRQMIAEKNIK